MTTVRLFFSLTLLTTLAACTAGRAATPPTTDAAHAAAPTPPTTDAAHAAAPGAGALAARLKDIEAKSGGRLGVGLYDADGRSIGGHRADERFAMCSTFKYALAAMVLADSATNKMPLDKTLTFRRNELDTYAPVAKKHLVGDEGKMSVAEAARAAVTLSDNTAANLLLAQIGGSRDFTARMRAWGDEVTRLDRVEPELNENARGDERDTTSPSAMASTLWRLAFGNLLPERQREQLREWGKQTETGRARIRHGLPTAWVAGDKTGSCGTAYNDIAWFETPDGRRFALTVYLDRPTGSADDANAAIASVAKAAVETITQR